MSRLKPLPETVMAAANLRRMAAEMILQAEALEASTQTNTKKHVEFAFSKKKMKERATCTR